MPHNNIIIVVIFEFRQFLTRWFRKIQDNIQEISIDSLTVRPYQSLLHIIRVPMSDSVIIYECVVSNKLGQDKRQISLSATLPFAVSAYPSKQVSLDCYHLQIL